VISSPSCLAPLLHSDILPGIQSGAKRMHVRAVRLQIRFDSGGANRGNADVFSRSNYAAGN
jgi:hypothetical protein